MAGKIRAAAYARVSTDKDDQANSLVSQRQYFADFITSQENWQLTRVYYDEGISGTNTKKRAGFNEMIEDALHGEIDLILTKEVSRFARNTVDTLAFTRKLKEAGVGVIFTIDNIDTRDSDGELRLTIMASMAQEESRKTSERVKWGQQRRMEQGVVFGRDLIGYRVENGKLMINEEEAPIVRAVFHKYTNEGKGTGVIARELLEEGMRPKRVSVWSSTVVLRMLKNEKYVGDLCQKKTITPDYLTHAKKYNRGEEKKVYIRDHHEPIIERDLWDRTQEELRRRSVSGKQRQKYSNRYWCSGKIFCGECGARFVKRKKIQKSGKLYEAWRCHGAAQYGAQKTNSSGRTIGCSSSLISEKALLFCMSHCIRMIPVNRERLKKEVLNEIKQLKGFPAFESDTVRIQKQLKELRDKKRKMYDLLLDGLVTKEDLDDQNAWYTENMDALKKQLERAGQEERICSQQLEEMGPYMAALDDILNFSEKDQLLYREILDKIIVYKGGRLEIWFKAIPFGIELKIRSFGRQERYRTEILETRFLTGTECCCDRG